MFHWIECCCKLTIIEICVKIYVSVHARPSSPFPSTNHHTSSVFLLKFGPIAFRWGRRLIPRAHEAHLSGHSLQLTGDGSCRNMDSLPNKKRQQQQQQQQPKNLVWIHAKPWEWICKERFLVILVVHVVHETSHEPPKHHESQAKSQPPQSQWTDYLADHHGVDLGPVVPPVLMDEISPLHVGWQNVGHTVDGSEILQTSWGW